MNSETDGIALITQYSGRGLFIALEELGYITMRISFLFLAPVFSINKPLEKSIRIILISQFALTVCSFLFYTIEFGIDRSYRFEVATITINWGAAITVGILICVFIKRTLKTIKEKATPHSRTCRSNTDPPSLMFRWLIKQPCMSENSQPV